MERLCERVMKGDFPEEGEPDHKAEVNAKFYENAKNAKVRLRRLYKSADSIFSQVESFKKYFEWIPVSEIMNFNDYRKDDSVSKHLRDIAKEHFKDNKLSLSLRAFNISLLFVSDLSEMYICHAERSELLFKMEYYEDCLKDCEFYLQAKHKEHDYMVLEIEERGRKCRNILEVKISAEDEMLVAKADIQKRLKYRQNLLFRVKQPNPKAPSAENFVTIGNDAVKGRKLLVTRDVPAGTVLVVEEPYAKVLMNGLKWDVSHCHHCFKKIRTGIPCQNCVFAFYCSATCKENAVATYHKYECKCLPYMHVTRTPRYVQLAVRIVINAGFKDLYQIFATKDRKFYEKLDNVITGADPTTHIYDSKSYLPIFNLMDHINKASEVEQYTSIVQGLIFAHVLEKIGGFFAYPENSEIPPDVIHTFIASIIVRHLQNVPCNSISLDEIDDLHNVTVWNQHLIAPGVLSAKIRSLKYSQSGSAVYALSSLMNHSCVPNVARIHDLTNGRMALVALPSLSAGEELTTSYSRIFFSDELQERLQYLESTYRFKCDCTACLKDWPVISLLNEAQPLLCCSSCTKKAGNRPDFSIWEISGSGKCRMCSKQYQIEDVQREFGRKMSQFFQAYELVLDNKTIDAIRLIAPVIQYFQFNVCPPFSKSHMSHDILKQAIDLTIFFSENITSLGKEKQFLRT